MVIGIRAADDASQRHLLSRASTVGLLMRHCVNIGVALIALAEPGSGATAAGRVVLAGVLGWSLFRVATRSHGRATMTVDLGVTLAVCLAIPHLTQDPAFHLTNSAPQAIAGTAVVSFAVSLPAALTAPMTIAIAVAYAAGTAQVSGWGQVGSVLAVYYFALQWGTAAVIRGMLLRAATAVDRARRARETAETAREVEEAVRTFEREQLALLHDTAASTLLIVGQGTDLPPERLAAQARRDLELLSDGPWRGGSTPVELVGALRTATAFARTPTLFDGHGRLWVSGDIAQAVIAATREAMNNVDRHAHARRVRIVAADASIEIIDDGIGFDPAAAAAGHGLAESIAGRMVRVGGTAEVISAPGAGTTVALTWTAARPTAAPVQVEEREQSIDRMRVLYAWALTLYAVANLVTTVPYGISHAGHPVAQAVLAVVAGTCALLALPPARRRIPLPVWLGPVVLAAVMVVQMMLLAPEQLGTQADWTQGGIGWCVLPWVLQMSTRRAAGVLVGVWVLGGVLEICRHPIGDAVVNVGLGTASILGVQLFALVFDGLMRDAAAAIHADVTAHRGLVVSERIARAVAEDYRRRYARLVDNVVPLLQRLGDGEPVSESLRREARAESRRMRTLFDQSRVFDHPVMRRLRPVIDAADAEGIDVSVDLGGVLPPLGENAADELVEPLRTALSADQSGAHLVVSATHGAVTMSLVCRDVADPHALECALTALGGQVIVSGGTVWLIIDGEGDRPRSPAVSPHDRSSG
ncbi:sensor histidine kinase [Mycolicibacterium litorale]|uniref:sensor histidine kinase n=1 Tax=Mycolicibacterium litorale TaxID=758802 RepID=UPI003CECD527